MKLNEEVRPERLQNTVHYTPSDGVAPMKSKTKIAINVEGWGRFNKMDTLIRRIFSGTNKKALCITINM